MQSPSQVCGRSWNSEVLQGPGDTNPLATFELAQYWIVMLPKDRDPLTVPTTQSAMSKCWLEELPPSFDPSFDFCGKGDT